MIYQQLINGLMLGASYALVAIGYTLIFGVLNLLYFAHGEVFMVGAFVGLFLVVYAGANIYGALLGAMVICAILGVIAVFVAVRPVRKDRPLAPLISTIGLTIVIQNLAVYLIGGQQLAFPETIAQKLYHFGPVTISFGAAFHPRRGVGADGAALAVHRAHQDGPRHPRHGGKPRDRRAARRRRQPRGAGHVHHRLRHRRRRGRARRRQEQRHLAVHGVAAPP